MSLTVGSLFAGIGGFDLAAERVGFQVKWQVEIDDFATRVLEKHWPGVKRFRDVRDVGRRNLDPVDIICGGFPCQDISDAGLRAGIDGARSGLWREMARLCGELRPRYIVVENVAALLARGMDRVLGDLATIGYDAEWECLPAFAFGAPHRRDRVFIVAYPQGDGMEAQRLSAEGQRDLSDVDRGDTVDVVEHAERRRLQGGIFGCPKPPAAFIEPRHRARFGRHVGASWHPEPSVDLLDDGLPADVAECISRGIGNAIVPQVAEWIFRRIKEAEVA